MIEMCIVEGTAKDVEASVNQLLSDGTGWKLWTGGAVTGRYYYERNLPSVHVVYLTRERAIP